MMIEGGMVKEGKNKDGQYELNNEYIDKIRDPNNNYTHSKDQLIIEHIVTKHNYQDKKCSKIYYKYIATENQAATVDRYFSEARNIEKPQKSIKIKKN
jgi:hypothetical protein